MRWLLLVGLLTACTDDTADVPATVVRVDVQADCGTTNCGIALSGMCGYDMPLIEPTTRDLTVATGYDADELVGVVQLQYPGPLTNEPDGTPGHIDSSLVEGDHVEVYGLFGQYDPSRVLYRIDPAGAVTDIDTTLLTGAEGSVLHFAYDNVTEVHTIDPPRTVNVQTTTPCYCSLAGPHELGIVLAVALLPLRRRRKLRA